MNRELLADLVVNYFVAFGVIIGGSLVGGIGAFFNWKSPSFIHVRSRRKLEIWAIVAAIGGSFDAITSVERGLFQGTHDDLFKTLFMLFCALCGAHSGSVIIQWIAGSNN